MARKVNSYITDEAKAGGAGAEPAGAEPAAGSVSPVGSAASSAGPADRGTPSADLVTKPARSGSGLGSALDLIGTIVIVAAIVLCLFVSVPRFFGITSYTVLTGSMEPTIPVGSLVMARSVDPAGLQAGDVVVFYDGMSQVPVTHRVVENSTAQGTITTQGDANAAPDMAPIPYPNIVGKMLIHIPGVGALLAPLGSMQGKFCLICIILGAMFLSLAGRRAKRRG